MRDPMIDEEKKKRDQEGNEGAGAADEESDLPVTP